MLDTSQAASTPKKKYFWSPILSGTTTAIILFTLLLYFNVLNVFTGLLIPFISGFICLSLSIPIVKQDKLCQLFLPWVTLVLLIPFVYWKLKIFIIIMFPIASFGGWLAGYLLTNRDDE